MFPFDKAGSARYKIGEARQLGKMSGKDHTWPTKVTGGEMWRLQSWGNLCWSDETADKRHWPKTIKLAQFDPDLWP